MDIGKRTNEEILELNTLLVKISEAQKVNYIDVYSYLINSMGELNIAYTTEGLHLNGDGYQKVVEVLSPYIEE